MPNCWGIVPVYKSRFYLILRKHFWLELCEFRPVLLLRIELFDEKKNKLQNIHPKMWCRFLDLFIHLFIHLFIYLISIQRWSSRFQNISPRICIFSLHWRPGFSIRHCIYESISWHRCSWQIWRNFCQLIRFHSIL